MAIAVIMMGKIPMLEPLKKSINRVCMFYLMADWASSQAFFILTEATSFELRVDWPKV